ncbi:MAG: DALR domain-containing protein, partial [Microgenomates group bacterium]
GLVFSWDSLRASRTAMEKLKNYMISLREQARRTSLSSEKQRKIDDYRERFLSAINDDLNTPQALAVLWEMLKSNVPSEDKYDLAASFDEVLGFGLATVQVKAGEIPEKIQKLAEEREVLRRKGKFDEADKIRKEILKMRYLIEDTPKGPSLKKIDS